MVLWLMFMQSLIRTTDLQSSPHKTYFLKKCFLNYFISHFAGEKQSINPLSASPRKWSNTFKPTNCLSLFDHFVGLALKGLMTENRDVLRILLNIHDSLSWENK